MRSYSTRFFAAFSEVEAASSADWKRQYIERVNAERDIRAMNPDPISVESAIKALLEFIDKRREVLRRREQRRIAISEGSSMDVDGDGADGDAKDEPETAPEVENFFARSFQIPGQAGGDEDDQQGGDAADSFLTKILAENIEDSQPHIVALQTLLKLMIISRSYWQF
jgi:hypothetical protein